MSRTAVVFSPIYYQHDTGVDHPESARRLRAIISELRRDQLSKSKKWMFVEPGKASMEDVESIHDREYIEHVRAVCRSGGGILDSGDTLVSRDSFEVALYAAGGALKAVSLVMKGQFENVFALVRPPGHHAEKFHACGFCVFNNIAIATQNLVRKFNLKRVLIFDIDAHHGNGTQEAFYETGKVLYISLHEDLLGFPGTGFIDEVGEGEGLGYNVNIPLPFRTSDQIYLRAVNEIAVPIIRQYKPQFMLVSAGFDGHYTDPVGSLSLSALCYKEVFETIVGLASQICNGKLMAILEGGYSLEFVGKITALAIAEMSGSPYVIKDRFPVFRKKVRMQGEKVLRGVQKVQRGFWNIG
jgi:acetoin utilization deacetylase AcuC-like enzyme